MNRFNNPLDNLRVASPCPANWDEMYGNERKRFCAECKLNVYNLSEMTRDEAERFLISSEGRVCVRFYRRKDGTVLTQDCPVGWAAVKRRVSRIATAAFSMVVGFFGGLFVFNFFRSDPPMMMGAIAVHESVTQGKPAYPSQSDSLVDTGTIEVKGEMVEYTVGQRVLPVPREVKKPKRK
ncbi:MAG TPA: hypothetical protein VGQ55_14590 [Pyrinomonadaceae bacterium]|jgi:hypothetical protein|nr:hypothetical protein [Pyrinomonadaceae bacterium]